MNGENKRKRKSSEGNYRNGQNPADLCEGIGLILK
jgi:hypothetical protein